MPKIENAYGGFDPGMSGGIALVRGKVCALWEMPETEHDLWVLVRELSESTKLDGVLVENVHSMPSQSSQSSFTFGKGYGGLRMALIAASIPFDEVTPQAWMKAFGLKRKPHTKTKRWKNRKGKIVDKRYGGETDTQWKKRLLAKAQQLFPKAENLNLKTADSLLIACYNQRKSEGRL